MVSVSTNGTRGNHIMENMTRPASYAVAMLHEVQPGEGMETYLSEIDDTLSPYGGTFLIHGGSPRVMEGTYTHDLIVIGFPDADGADRWYDSPKYQRLAALRQTFASGDVFLCNGEGADHRAIDILSRHAG